MGKVGHAPAMAVKPRQSGSQGTIVGKETAAEIRQEVLRKGEEVYRLTCSDARAIDEAWRDLSAWIGWDERLLGGEQRKFTLPWKKKGQLRWGKDAVSDSAGCRRGVLGGQLADGSGLGLQEAITGFLEKTELNAEETGDSKVRLSECYGADWFQMPWQSTEIPALCQSG